MATLGKQLQQGLTDVGKAASSDVVEGLVDVGKKMAGEVVTGGGEPKENVDSGGQLQSVSSEEAERRMMKERQARARIEQLRQELAAVVRNKERVREEAIQREASEEAASDQQESSRKKRLRDLLLKAKRGGGTGEVVKQTG